MDKSVRMAGRQRDKDAGRQRGRQIKKAGRPGCRQTEAGRLNRQEGKDAHRQREAGKEAD